MALENLVVLPLLVKGELVLEARAASAAKPTRRPATEMSAPCASRYSRARPVCGSACTTSCSGVYPVPVSSIGRGRSPTPAIFARFGGLQTGPSPVDRGRAGSKHHLLTDASGLPLAFTLTAGNRNDVTQLLPLLDRVKPVRGRRGRPRKRPDQVIADRGYDSKKHRRALRRRGIKAVIARRGTEHGSGLGVYRWVIERSFSWLHQFRRLRTRYERDPTIHEAFMHLGCAIICWRRLNSL